MDTAPSLAAAQVPARQHIDKASDEAPTEVAHESTASEPTLLFTASGTPSEPPSSENISMEPFFDETSSSTPLTEVTKAVKQPVSLFELLDPPWHARTPYVANIAFADSAIPILLSFLAN